MSRSKLAVTGLWLAAVVSVIVLVQTGQVSTDTLIGRGIQLVSDHAWGLPVILLAYLIRPYLLMPPSLLTMGVGSLFGFWVALPIALCGELLSSGSAYAGGRAFMPRLGRAGIVSRLRDRLAGNPFLGVYCMRAMFIPFDLVNFGCGALRIPVVPYTVATALGILPGLCAFVSFGSSFRLRQILGGDVPTNWVAVFDLQQLLVSGLLVVVSLLIALLVRSLFPNYGSAVDAPKAPD